ncbi:hypothetical protein SRS16CHR_01822 [Variovorax sp. SRS16]|uniref:hypothetical protein n=1 Tax=Variovorax sp. SRS16 TaxID=282217 RepID=UPI001315FA16|nr:hypothetical protein [Variovorax sp. SRS16]VTU16622.1 hypothetical protein SRS16CHR_01822 [Variovorax sp. SRS16]
MQHARWKLPVPGLVLFAAVMVAAIFAAAIGLNVAFERSLRGDARAPGVAKSAVPASAALGVSAASAQPATPR